MLIVVTALICLPDGALASAVGAGAFVGAAPALVDPASAESLPGCEPHAATSGKSTRTRSHGAQNHRGDLICHRPVRDMEPPPLNGAKAQQLTEYDALVWDIIKPTAMNRSTLMINNSNSAEQVPDNISPMNMCRATE
jgi:hypothetical protein